MVGKPGCSIVCTAQDATVRAGTRIPGGHDRNIAPSRHSGPCSAITMQTKYSPRNTEICALRQNIHQHDLGHTSGLWVYHDAVCISQYIGSNISMKWKGFGRMWWWPPLQLQGSLRKTTKTLRITVYLSNINLLGSKTSVPSIWICNAVAYYYRRIWCNTSKKLEPRVKLIWNIITLIITLD